MQPGAHHHAEEDAGNGGAEQTGKSQKPEKIIEVGERGELGGLPLQQESADQYFDQIEQVVYQVQRRSFDDKQAAEKHAYKGGRNVHWPAPAGSQQQKGKKEAISEPNDVRSTSGTVGGSYANNGERDADEQASQPYGKSMGVPPPPSCCIRWHNSPYAGLSVVNPEW